MNEFKAFLYGMLVGVALTIVILVITKPEKIHNYKAQILESNTIIYIKDSLYTYEPGEQVWVNVDTKYVDNSDSTAMKCLIIKTM